MISNCSINSCKNLSCSSSCCCNCCCNSCGNGGNENGFGSITVYNKGAYIAYTDLGYYINGQFFHELGPYMPVGKCHTVIIPANAEQITFLALFTLSFIDYYIICRKDYPVPVKKCFNLWGTIFNPSCEEIPCPSTPCQS